jgi:hypothetical protein
MGRQTKINGNTLTIWYEGLVTDEADLNPAMLLAGGGKGKAGGDTISISFPSWGGPVPTIEKIEISSKIYADSTYETPRVLIYGNGDNVFKDTTPDRDPSKTNMEGAVVTGYKECYLTTDSINPTLTVEVEGKKLTEGTDFTRTNDYNGNKEGNGYITLKGTGNYQGEKVITFSINDPEKVSIDPPGNETTTEGDTSTTTATPPDVTTTTTEGDTTTTTTASSDGGDPTTTTTVNDGGDPTSTSPEDVTTTTTSPEGPTTTTTTPGSSTTVIKGDFNRDGNLTSADLTIAKRSLAGWTTVETPEQLVDVGDLNASGTVGSTDLVILKRHFAEMSGYGDLNAYYDAALAAKGGVVGG